MQADPAAPIAIVDFSVPPPVAPMKVRVRAPLKTTRDVANFLSTLCREARAGKLSPGQLAQWASALQVLGKMREGDVSERLDMIEAALKARNIGGVR